MNGIDTRFRTGNEQGKTAVIGGRASGKKRRQKKAMRDAWEAIRRLPLTDEQATDIKTLRSAAELRGANITVEQAVVLAIVNKALGGDAKAFQTLMDLTADRERLESMAAEKTALELSRLRMDVTHMEEQRGTHGVLIVDDVK